MHFQFTHPAREDLINCKETRLALNKIENDLNTKGLTEQHLVIALPSIFGCTKEDVRSALDLTTSLWSSLINKVKVNSLATSSTVSTTLLVRLYIKHPEYWPIPKRVHVDLNEVQNKFTKVIASFSIGQISVLTGKSLTRGYEWRYSEKQQKNTSSRTILKYFDFIKDKDDLTQRLKEYLNITEDEAKARNTSDIVNRKAWPNSGKS
jgi:hypothetical protein